MAFINPVRVNFAPGYAAAAQVKTTQSENNINST